MTTTHDLTLREAQLIEAARELLHVSQRLNPDKTVDYGALGGVTVESAHHVVLVSAALEGLDSSRLGDWTNYGRFVDVAAEESNALGNGDPAEYFNSPDALIEAINEERAEQERGETTTNG